MWMPTPVYERIPQFWLLLGLLFMSSGTYLGFDYSLSFVYFGVGFACCIWSLWIFAMRLRNREEVKDQQRLVRRVQARQDLRASQQLQVSQQEQASQQPEDDLSPGAEPAA
jgi:hypothetical protein